MDLTNLTGQLQGALWKKDKRLVIVVCKNPLPKALAANPRVQAAREPPKLRGSRLPQMALVLFAQPYSHQAAEEFQRSLGIGSDKPRIVVWDQAMSVLETALLNALVRNPIRGEKAYAPPEEVLERFSPKPEPRTHASSFKRGELKEFVRRNARPNYGPKSADIQRIHGLIADGPGKPSLGGVGATYYKLVAEGLIVSIRSIKTA